MAGFLGYSVSNELLNFLYRGIAIDIEADLYLRLLVGSSNRGGGGTETNYSGYSRLILPRDTTVFAAPDNGFMSNAVVIEFPSASTLGNGDFLAFDVVDTPSGAFTKIYNGGPIVPAKAVQLNKPQRFAIGALQFTF